MAEIFYISSIAQLHQLCGLSAPTHPLISLIHTSALRVTPELAGLRSTSALYCISHKNPGKGIDYGRNHYDFHHSGLMFIAPNQVVTVRDDAHHDDGWMLFFHPDLIRKTALGNNLSGYPFFAYDTFEAIHLKEGELAQMTEHIKQIELLINANAQAEASTFAALLRNILELSVLPYKRYITQRNEVPRDVLTAFEGALINYFQSDKLAEQGIPTVQHLANCVHLSPNYLSDLLKKETGKNAKEHINQYVVENARQQLLNSNKTVSQIAYALGFNYPHYFSRMFKRHTGYSPKEFRVRNPD